MSFLNQNLDSSDEDDSKLFRHSERNFEALLAEQQRQRQRPTVANQRTTKISAKKLGKRKSDQRQSDDEDIIEKRRKSASRSASPTFDTLADSDHSTTKQPTRKRGKAGSIEVTSPTDRASSVSESEPDSATHLPNHRGADIVELRDEDSCDEPRDYAEENQQNAVIDESDDEFAEVIRQARQAQKQKSAGRDKEPLPSQTIADRSLESSAGLVTEAEPVVDIILTSYLQSTKPLRVKIRLSQQLGIVREAWCRKHGFTDEVMRDIFLVYRLRKIYDMSTCRSLGLDVDSSGRLIMKGAENNLAATEVHLQAADEEIFQQLKNGTLSADGPLFQEAAAPEIDGPDSSIASEKVNLVLRANSRADFKISTKPVSQTRLSPSLITDQCIGDFYQ